MSNEWALKDAQLSAMKTGEQEPQECRPIFFIYFFFLHCSFGIKRLVLSSLPAQGTFADSSERPCGDSAEDPQTTDRSNGASHGNPHSMS